MSSNASVLFPIREEDGVKKRIEQDVLDEIESSIQSSIASKPLPFPPLEANYDLI